MTCEKKGCNREAVHCHYKYWEEKTLKGDHQLIAKKHPEWFEWLCAKHHAEVHEIDPKQSELKRLVIMRDRAIKRKNVLNNQIKGLGDIEYKIPKQMEKRFKKEKKVVREWEKKIKEQLEKEYSEMWEWFSKIKGISHVTAGKLLAWIDIKDTPTVSSLWRYSGMGYIKNGKAVRRRKNMSKKEAEKCGNPYLKKEILGVLASSFIRQNTQPYRDIYDNEKERQLKREYEKGELKERYGRPYKKKDVHITQGHAHRRAIRKMMKIFLQHFWVEWRKVEDLPVTEPYVKAKLNHKNLIEPSV